MDLREDSFSFPPFKGSGPRTAVTSPMHRFPRRVTSAVAGITGYSVSFDREDDDHEWGRLQIELSTAINAADPRDVEVGATFGLRDHSGNWDDSYSAVIQYVVLAQLEPVVPPGPGESRGDLVIVDAEFNQAIQHFRSDKHLDAANVFPDNSIRLIADKPTGVRLYVDYDRNSGLTQIASLSGEIEVTAGATVQTITPWNVITPRRDTEVDRTQAGHTVNFTLPESLCTGSIRIRAKVFDAVDQTQFSATFERTLTFVDGPAIPVMCVGINYTGPDVIPGAPAANLIAPPQAAFTTLFTFMEQVYPIPQVTQTGYMTMDYDEEIKSDITKGCDKFDDLLDALEDLRGDATDFFFGLLNIGVDRGTVGGCGSKSKGVCAGTIGRGDLAGHEMGHVLGRKHAPCDNVTRCKRPLDTDGDYPVYVGYPSDSIGEFGFDTSDGSIRDPATSFDVMGYSKPRWIGPYTYKAVMSRVPIPPGSSVEFALARSDTGDSVVYDDDEWILVKRPYLHVRLSIARDRAVAWQPAFHFPSLPREIDDRATDFTIEFLDAKGNVLGHHCLFANDTGCGCCSECGDKTPLWPLPIRQAVPFDERSSEVRIYECDKKIWSAQIGPPPRVKLTARDEGDFVRFEWKAARGTPTRSLWYLLQWRDRYGTWRGCAPRTQATQLDVPKRLFGRHRQIAARVLATSGIATGVGTWEGSIAPGHQGPPPRYEVEIVVPGVEAGTPGPWPVKPLLRVGVVDRFGSSPPRTLLRWYRDDGIEVGRGRSVDLRRLPFGRSRLRAVVLDGGSGTGERTMEIERTRHGAFLIHDTSASETKSAQRP